ncbi:hypothetical protein Tco_1279975, partial [Tanacetum coccineum]
NAKLGRFAAYRGGGPPPSDISLIYRPPGPIFTTLELSKRVLFTLPPIVVLKSCFYAIEANRHTLLRRDWVSLLLLYAIEANENFPYKRYGKCHGSSLEANTFYYSTVGGRRMLFDMAGYENILEQAGQTGFEAKIQVNFLIVSTDYERCVAYSFISGC